MLVGGANSKYSGFLDRFRMNISSIWHKRAADDVINQLSLFGGKTAELHCSFFRRTPRRTERRDKETDETAG